MKAFSVLSDFHFEHENILKTERHCFNTIESHDEKVFRAFKKALQTNTFYFLGDFGLAQSRAQRGEWVMSIEIVKGDCLEELKEIADSSIDLTVTSPPC